MPNAMPRRFRNHGSRLWLALGYAKKSWLNALFVKSRREKLDLWFIEEGLSNQGMEITLFFSLLCEGKSYNVSRVFLRLQLALQIHSCNHSLQRCRHCIISTERISHQSTTQCSPGSTWSRSFPVPFDWHKVRMHAIHRLGRPCVLHGSCVVVARELQYRSCAIQSDQKYRNASLLQQKVGVAACDSTSTISSGWLELPLKTQHTVG